MSTIKTYPTLFKRDTKGRLRQWYMQQNGPQHRSVAGLVDGKQTESGWFQAIATNVGKANERDPVIQAEFDIEAEYKKKKGQSWSEVSPDDQPEKHDLDKRFEPMLAHKYPDHKDKIKFPVYCQPKLDGIRCIARADGLWTRTGKKIHATPHIFEALSPLFEANAGLVFDGELYNHHLKADFNKITSLVKKAKPTEADLAESKRLIQYHIYDGIQFGNTNRSFASRQESVVDLIESLFDDQADEVLVLVPTVCVANAQDLDVWYADWLQDGYEGQMVRINEAYEHKRSRFLLKRKEFEDEECTITGITEGDGNWAGYAKSIDLVRDNGTRFSAGLRGGRTVALEVLTNKDKYINKRATVRYQNLTPDGVPRFPIVVDFDRGDF